MIFAVLDPSPLTLCINCSFFTFIRVSAMCSLQCVDTVGWWQEGHPPIKIPVHVIAHGG